MTLLTYLKIFEDKWVLWHGNFLVKSDLDFRYNSQRWTQPSKKDDNHWGSNPFFHQKRCIEVLKELVQHAFVIGMIFFGALDYGITGYGVSRPGIQIFSNSDFCKLLRLPISSILKNQKFPLGELIFMQKPFLFGIPGLETP